MINTQIKIHDKFSVEVKIGFFVSQKVKNIDKFKINTWIFAPNGLDINSFTYSKEQFYSDLKSNVRLITPIYSPAEILKKGKGPFPRLEKSIENLLNEPNEIYAENYTYQIKMLLCILKSAFRENCNRISRQKDEKQIIESTKDFANNITTINTQYRKIRDDVMRNPAISEELKEYFLFGDEYLGDITENSIYFLLHCSRSKQLVYDAIKSLLFQLIENEDKNKQKMVYSVAIENEEEHNSLILIKKSLLKKFVESDLYLQRIKKTDGAFTRELYYSLAAGLAMIFATVVSFIATQQFGNFTSSFFLVLVVSYIFKDRIKELARFYFSSKLDQRYFDWKWNVSIRNQKIGVIKEGFDFIPQEKVPEEIQNLRNKTPLVKAENQIYDEKVILYRKRVFLSKKDLEKYKEYHLSGINDIIRLNLTSFTKQMDNPTIPIRLPDQETGLKTILGKRVYALYFILECKSEEEVYYKKYRLLLNRNGISDVAEIF
jgi:hypothetical protein